MNEQMLCFRSGDETTFVKINDEGSSRIMTPELLSAMDAEGIKGGEIGLLIYAIKSLFSKLTQKDEDHITSPAADNDPLSFCKEKKEETA